MPGYTRLPRALPDDAPVCGPCRGPMFFPVRTRNKRVHGCTKAIRRTDLSERPWRVVTLYCECTCNGGEIEVD